MSLPAKTESVSAASELADIWVLADNLEVHSSSVVFQIGFSTPISWNSGRTYTVSARAVDEAGNKLTLTNNVFTYDTEVPETYVDTPVDGRETKQMAQIK